MSTATWATCSVVSCSVRVMKLTAYFRLVSELGMDGVYIHYPFYIHDMCGESSASFFDCDLYNDAVRNCTAYNLLLFSQHKEI